MVKPAQLSRLRQVVVVSLPLWIVSFALLLWASTSARVIAPWELTCQGVVDVLAALAVCVLSIVIYVRAQALVDEPARRLSYTIATAVPTLVLVALWVYADRLRFDVLLPGLAWRLYMLLMTLPAALAIWRKQPL